MSIKIMLKNGSSLGITPPAGTKTMVFVPAFCFNTLHVSVFRLLQKYFYPKFAKRLSKTLRRPGVPPEQSCCRRLCMVLSGFVGFCRVVCGFILFYGSPFARTTL